MAPTFAPLIVSFQRRLQTGAVALVVHLIPLTTLAYVGIILNSSSLWAAQVLRTVALVYLAWVLIIDKTVHATGGRLVLYVRTLYLFKLTAKYFPAHLLVVGGKGLDPYQQYIFALHPHGIISISHLVSIATNTDFVRVVFAKGEPSRPAKTEHDLVPRFLTITIHFMLPVWRELMLALGFVSASRASAMACLSQGMNIAVAPGGALESLYSGPGSSSLALGKRKGFIRLALQFSANLVPVYSFGENELYDHTPRSEGSLIRKIQVGLISLLGFTIPFARGRGIFQYTYGLLPRRVPIHTVIGLPIAVQQVTDPTPAQVDELHGKYITAIRQLHEEFAEKYFSEAKAALAAQGEDVKTLRLQPFRILD